MLRVFGSTVFLFILIAVCGRVEPARALVRVVDLEVNGEAFYGVVVNGQRARRPSPDDGTGYEDLTFASLEHLLFDRASLLTQASNLDLWNHHPDSDLAFSTELNWRQVAEANATIEKILKRLIEQWVIEQYKKTRPYLDPSFFDLLRRQEPLDRAGMTTLALFDANKRLVATLSLAVRTKDYPLLDLERRLNFALPPVVPYSTRVYPLMRVGGATFPGLVTVSRDAELKKFVLEPELDRTLIPVMLYLLDRTGILAFGLSLHPDFDPRPPGLHPLALAPIGTYYLEADERGMRMYRNPRRYNFAVVGKIDLDNTYVMSSGRDQLVRMWQNFVPTSDRRVVDFAQFLRSFKINEGPRSRDVSGGLARVHASLQAFACQSQLASRLRQN